MKNYQGTIVKRGSGYHWRFKTISGAYTMQVLKTENGATVNSKEEAEKIASSLSKELHQIHLLQTKAEYLTKTAEVKGLINICKVSIAELESEFLSHPARREVCSKHEKNYLSVIRHFKNWSARYSCKMLVDVTEAIAGKYLRDYWDTGISSKTYNERLNMMSIIFRLFLKEDNPFKSFPNKIEQMQSREAFTREQLQRIWHVLDSAYHMMYKPEMKVLYSLALYTGARCGDLCLLKWTSVDLDNSVIRFVPSKTMKSSRKEIILPIATPLLSSLQEAVAWRINEYVLPNVSSRYKRNPSGIYYDTILMLERAGIQTKIEKGSVRRQKRILKYSMHSFRHSHATLLINSGVSSLVVRDMLGHASENMTARYSHIDIATKKQALQIIPDVMMISRKVAEPDLDQPNQTLQEKIHQIIRKMSVGELERVFAQLSLAFPEYQ